MFILVSSFNCHTQDIWRSGELLDGPERIEEPSFTNIMWGMFYLTVLFSYRPFYAYITHKYQQPRYSSMLIELHLIPNKKKPV